ncbi:hypothetical protein AAFF_G00098820 [Aldrovandia affinis]|uniref:Uncharacterized protein n=1 Tax=Aldrovandia affinis TaxID=143900 RepID=A0AAD7RVA3_9TELE|nr:hypothetical protein AAFF_G00098820 [Aldrovandia affinis]
MAAGDPAILLRSVGPPVTGRQVAGSLEPERLLGGMRDGRDVGVRGDAGAPSEINRGGSIENVTLTEGSD